MNRKANPKPARSRPEFTLERPGLLDYLWKAQNKRGFVGTEDITQASLALGVSSVEIEGVVSFYHFFSRRPRGQFTIYLNNSIVSQFKGFERVSEAFEMATGATMNGVDPSGQFGLFETPCIGLSDCEPSALINFRPFTHLNSLKVKEIVARLKQGAAPDEICERVPDHIRSVPAGDRAILLREYEYGKAVLSLRERSRESIIDEVKASGLRGMGGAFFPAGLKWEYCSKEPAIPKYIVCNADEGEPGTFKDRVLMNSMPGLLLEGMVIGAYSVGATEGIVYLRAEYTWLKDKLQREIDHFRRMNLLGRNIIGIEGFDFDVRIQLGAGAYVCGEETGLLNSLEGRRGEPRNKRFFPTQRGYLLKPTVVNNVETFCAAARIIELGTDHFRRVGTPNSPGTKLLSVSGDIRLPGIYEIEWGARIGDILEECEADHPNFVQIGGPSGECISMAEADRSIALGDLPCGGSVMVFSRHRDVLDILRNYTRFFRHESCGLCTPCRAGNFIIDNKLELFASKLARQEDVDDLRSWGKIMKLTCRCGLGQSAPNSLLSAQQKFPEYFKDIVDQNPERLSTGFSLEDAVREYDRFKS